MIEKMIDCGSYDVEPDLGSGSIQPCPRSIIVVVDRRNLAVMSQFISHCLTRSQTFAGHTRATLASLKNNRTSQLLYYSTQLSLPHESTYEH